MTTPLNAPNVYISTHAPPNHSDLAVDFGAMVRRCREVKPEFVILIFAINGLINCSAYSLIHNFSFFFVFLPFYSTIYDYLMYLFDSIRIKIWKKGTQFFQKKKRKRTKAAFWMQQDIYILMSSCTCS